MSKQKLTISAMKQMNESIGETWFGKQEMSFFNTRIEAQPNKDNIFITSDHPGDPETKGYALRQFDINTGKVETLGDIRQYDTLSEARQARRNYKGDK